MRPLFYHQTRSFGGRVADNVLVLGRPPGEPAGSGGKRAVAGEVGLVAFARHLDKRVGRIVDVNGLGIIQKNFGDVGGR